jgi:small GTP-binding protein
MISKKLCMLGTFAVGKTSLVSRFVHGVFSDTYLTTVGAKIDRRVLRLDGEPVTLILWDLAGDDDLQQVRASHLRGAAGYLLVVDGTRPRTLEVALGIRDRARSILGDVPYVVALNKVDRVDDWMLADADAEQLGESALAVVRTSALHGHQVEHAFELLARATTGRVDDG